MKTYQECCAEIAQKHKLGNNLTTGHKAKYFQEAAKLYAEGVVDECAEKAETQEWPDYQGENESFYTVNQESILKIKEQL